MRAWGIRGVVVLMIAVSGVASMPPLAAVSSGTRVQGGGWTSRQERTGDRFGRLDPAAPPETEQWGQLAGAWVCTTEVVAPDGASRTTTSTWTWAYALDGFAVRDRYVGQERADGGPRFHGTALRVYNPTLERWEISWIDNGATADGVSKLKLYEATYEQGSIIMRQREGDPAWSTIFFDIADDRFEWRNEPSGQTMTCLRTS